MANLFFELLQLAVGTRERLSCIPTNKDWFVAYQQAGADCCWSLFLWFGTGISATVRSCSRPSTTFANAMVRNVYRDTETKQSAE